VPIDVDCERLLVVRVEDQINPALAGWVGASYVSPPQPLEQAHTLVRLLLGWAAEPLDGQARWRCAVAGGTRTVSIDPVAITATGGPTAPTANGESRPAGR
jgi:hypothetical protein